MQSSNDIDAGASIEQEDEGITMEPQTNQSIIRRGRSRTLSDVFAHDKLGVMPEPPLVPMTPITSQFG